MVRYLTSKTMLPGNLFFLSVLLFLSGLILRSNFSLAQSAPPAKSLAIQVQELLTVHCAACHGSASPGLGGLKGIEDLGRLIDKGLIVAGKPDKPSLMGRLTTLEQSLRMPLGQAPLADAEVALVRRWIEAGAPLEGDGQANPQSPQPQPAVVPRSETQTWALVLNDLEALANESPERARSVRYLSLGHRQGLQPSPQEAKVRTLVRNTISLVLNSLSWATGVTKPVFIDAQRMLARIDLAALEIDPGDWAFGAFGINKRRSGL